jgi:hypothetical protein
LATVAAADPLVADITVDDEVEWVLLFYK